MTNSSTTPERAGRSRGYIVVFIVLIAACAAVFIRLRLTPRPRPRSLPDLGPAPAFRLTERSGQPFASTQLAGKYWVADFIFTSCAGSCPAMSTQMRDLQQSFTKSGQVLLVSFSVDPAHDTPAKLRDYADGYMAQPGRWFFLTGSEGEVAALARDGFKLASGVANDASDPSVIASAPAIVHSQRFVLVDPAGRIRGYYDGAGSDAVQNVIADVRALQLTAAAEKKN
jgi:protein SCO1/2